MTSSEANTVAVLRCYFNASDNLIGELCGIMWTNAVAMALVGIDEPEVHSGRLGDALVSHASTVLGMNLNSYTMYQATCSECAHTAMYLTPSEDTAKECHNCGKNTIMLPPR